VAGIAHEFLEVDLVVAEGGAGLPARRGNLFQQAGLVLDDTHSAATAAPARLEHERTADRAGEPQNFGVVVRQRVRRRHDRDVRLDRQPSRFDLVAEPPHDLGRRTDERDAGLGAAVREIGVLGEEAVTGVDRVGARQLRDPDNVLYVEVSLDRPLAFADAVRFPRVEAVQRQAVLGRVDADGRDVQLLRRAKHADRYLAAVGDEDLVEHYCLERGFAAVRVPHSPLPATVTNETVA
jgi:hypothetical protein